MENDPFRHALTESFQPAALEFVSSLREKLETIKQRYPHKESTVNSCLQGLEDTPTLGHILVAAYVLNGGVSLKFQMDDRPARSADSDVQDFESLLQEIEGRIAGTDLITDTASLVASGTETPRDHASPHAEPDPPVEDHPLARAERPVYDLQ